MKLTAGRSQLCFYRRSGFEEVLLHLNHDGTTLNPPGHAEARWELKNSGGELRFSSQDGVCTARLRWDGRRYIGVLLDAIDASLEIYQAGEFSPAAWTGTDDDARRELTIVTVANSFTPGFARLWNSCRHWNITPLVLGFAAGFGGLASKILADTTAIALDHDCRLFQCMFWSEGDVEVGDNGIRNRITWARPLVVHGNGCSDMSKAAGWLGQSCAIAHARGKGTVPNFAPKTPQKWGQSPAVLWRTGAGG